MDLGGISGVKFTGSITDRIWAVRDEGCQGCLQISGSWTERWW